MLALRDAISAYEKGQGYALPEPQTLVGRLELEMYRHKLNKKNLRAYASKLDGCLCGSWCRFTASCSHQVFEPNVLSRARNEVQVF